MIALPLLALLAVPADTVVVGVLTDPATLDPHRATEVVSAAVITNVCETLVRFRPGSTRPEGLLATTWATLDRRVWTLTLRKDVRFHDGTPFDADAVLANLESLRRVRGFAGKAERAGPHVVTVTLVRPNAAFLATLSQSFFAMQSPRRLGDPDGVPVGTGPFRFVRARPGLVELAANPDYWGGPPRLQAVQFRRLASEQKLVDALLAGELDVTSAIGPDRVPDLRDRPQVTLDSQTGLNVAFLSVNNEREGLKNRDVRQALARAIDRERLVQRILAGHGVPAQAPLPPLLGGANLRARDLLLDRAGARRLLTRAGFPNGFETSLLVVNAPRPYLPHPRELATALQEDLATVGVEVRLREVPTWAEYVDRATRGDYDLALLGWQADSMDPNDFLSALLDSGSIGATNRSRYRSADMDAVLKRARMGSDPETRASIYREAQVLFVRDMPWIPLYHASVFTAHRKTTKGLVIGPTGLLKYDKAWKVP